MQLQLQRGRYLRIVAPSSMYHADAPAAPAPAVLEPTNPASEFEADSAAGSDAEAWEKQRSFCRWSQKAADESAESVREREPRTRHKCEFKSASASTKRGRNDSGHDPYAWFAHTSRSPPQCLPAPDWRLPPPPQPLRRPVTPPGVLSKKQRKRLRRAQEDFDKQQLKRARAGIPHTAPELHGGRQAPPGPVCRDASPGAGTGATALPFGQLPAELLARVLQLAGSAAAWRLRRVCRAWRAAAEGVAWEPHAPFALRLRSAEAALLAAELARGGRLRVRGALAVEVGGFAPARSEHLRALAALASPPPSAGAAWVVAEVRLLCGLRAPLSATGHVLDALPLLRPCAASLRRLCIASAPLDGSYASEPPAPPAEQLRRLLAPLSALDCLQLPGDFPLDGPLARALAESCPRLKRLGLALAAAGHLNELADLPLEALALHVTSADGWLAIDDIAAFGGGRAGQGLRSLVVLRDGCGPREAARLAPSGPALRALAGLPRLAHLEPGFVLGDGFGPPQARWLARLEGVPRVHAVVERGAGTAGGVRALADALRALKAAGSRLPVAVDFGAVESEADAADLAALLAACGGAAPVACTAELPGGGRALARALEALARCGALRAASLSATAPTDEDLGLDGWGPLQGLRRLGRALELRITLVSPQRYERGDWDHYGDGRRRSPIEEEYRAYLPSLVPAARVVLETEYSDVW